MSWWQNTWQILSNLMTYRPAPVEPVRYERAGMDPRLYTNRKIMYIIVHCTASPDVMDIGVKEIDEWHKKRGWSGCGYHFVIRRSGVLEYGRTVTKPGAHCRGANKDSVGVVLVGTTNFTSAQFESLRKLIKDLKYLYPTALIKSHNEFPSAVKQGKTCPNFNLQEVLDV